MTTTRGRIMASLVVGATLLMAAAWAIGPYVFEDRDHVESLDSRPVREAAQAACSEMRAAVEADPGVETAMSAAAAMVGRLRALGPEVLRADIPAEAWLDDWDRLLAARRAGQPVPVEDGVPIHRRMDELVKDLRECQVPRVLIR